MAESNYDPFRGFVGGKNSSPGSGRKTLGSRLKPIDWDKRDSSGSLAAASPPGAAAGASAARSSSSGGVRSGTTGGGAGGWVVFDAKKVMEMQAAAKHAAVAKRAGPTMTQEEADAWRAENGIKVFGEKCPAPLRDFGDLTMMPPAIQAAFKQQGFTKPTAIQGQSWPILFSGRDMVGIAKTGSGKTLSFIVPAIAHISAALRLNAKGATGGPICTVLAPTRELAQQIDVETRKVLPAQLRIVCIYGGAPKGPQLGQLACQPHILVGTPGRIIDFLEIKRLSLTSVSYLVLDEADRMLDMGFEPQVRQICGQIPPERQTLMFSATWPEEIQNLASRFQKDFIRINVGSTELLANPDVKQHIRFVDPHAKVAELRKIMDRFRNRRMLVFVRTKKAADQLESLLKGHGFAAMSIHGDKEQRQREYILDRFRRESNMTLVATDVAARGLDVKNLDVVINYDFPMSVEDYVHRIGRTGRAGAKGEAFTLLTKKESQLTAAVIQELIAVLEKAKQEVPTALRQWGDEAGFRRAPSAGFAGGQQRGRGASNTLIYRHSSRPTAELGRGGGGGGGGRGRGAPTARRNASFDPRGAAAPQSFFGVPAAGSVGAGDKRARDHSSSGGPRQGGLAAKRKRE